MPSGKLVGRPFRTAAPPVEADLRATAVRVLDDGRVILDQPVVREDGTAVISTLMSEAVLDAGVWRAWGVLAALAVTLFVLALVVADRLARSLTRPVTDLAVTAERLGRGDLSARVVPDGPDEVREVGHALNTLAARIGELLTHERESVADLSHRLRTPVTALRLDAEALPAGRRPRPARSRRRRAHPADRRADPRGPAPGAGRCRRALRRRRRGRRAGGVLAGAGRGPGSPGHGVACHRARARCGPGRRTWRPPWTRCSATCSRTRRTAPTWTSP